MAYTTRSVTGPAGIPAACGLLAVLGLAATAAFAQEPAGSRASLDEFVSQIFVHGMPYEEAAAFGPAAVPVLIRILQDPAQEARWANAAIMLAMIGDQRGVDAVFEFIRQPGAGDVTAWRHWARGNALMALGYSAHGGRSRAALQYLETSLQPGAWQKRGVRGAQVTADPAQATDAADATPEGDVDESLTGFAVAGLALSGTEEARRVLAAYRDAPDRDARHREVVDSLLAEHAAIARKGIATYDRERQQRVIPGRPEIQSRSVGSEAAQAADEPPLPDEADRATSEPNP